MPITLAREIPEDDITETLAFLQLRDERREQARQSRAQR